MPISDKSGEGPTITEGWRALELFTDRRRPTQHFVRYLNDDPPTERILIFEGDGGNGKSLLLRHFLEKCCKRFSREEWASLKGLSAGEFFDRIEADENADPVPVAFLDFGIQPRGDDRPQEAFGGLLMLRRQLATFGIQFPIFDFACVWYLQQIGGLTSERVARLFPSEQSNLALELLQTTVGAHWLTETIFTVLKKQFGNRLSLYFKQRAVLEEKISEIQRMDPQRELIEHLPRFFAEDTNANISASTGPERIVLLFDTHEALWGDRRDLSDELFFERDEWLRNLLANLHLEKGVVAVVAGREAPRWDRAAKFRIPSDFVDVQLVGHLTAADADEYLLRAGITDKDLRLEIGRYAEVSPDHIHPLHLGLGADVALAAFRKGGSLQPAEFRTAPALQERGIALVSRLLRYVDAELGFAVRALAAPRTFNREIYRVLGQEMRFRVTDSTFESLTSFSFVWRAASRGEGYFRLHDLLRRALQDKEDDVMSSAHPILESYYRGQGSGNLSHRVEAIYHANKTDWKRGADEWLQLFDNAERISDFEACRALLDLRSEITFLEKAEYARSCKIAGDYFFDLARYPEAREEYLEAIRSCSDGIERDGGSAQLHEGFANAHMFLGRLRMKLSEYDDALDNYDSAFEAFDAAHAMSSEVRLLNKKAEVLVNRGEMLAAMGRHEDALSDLEAALPLIDQALQEGGSNVDVHNNRGDALLLRGQSEMALARYENAEMSLEAAVVSYRAALNIDSADVLANNNIGETLQSLGQLQTTIAKSDEALSTLAQALEAYDRSLAHAPYDLYVLNNQGIVVSSIGQAHMSMQRWDDGIESFAEAIQIYDRILERAPDDVWVHNNKATAYLLAGLCHKKAGHSDEARMRYEHGIGTYEQAIIRAPNDLRLRSNLSASWRTLGDHELDESNDRAATENYRRSMHAAEEILSMSSDDILGQLNLALSQKQMAEISRREQNVDEARRLLEKASEILEGCVERVPDHIGVLSAQAEVSRAYGNLERSEEYLWRSVALTDRALGLAPNDPDIHRDKAEALLDLAELLSADNLRREEIIHETQKTLARVTELALSDDQIPALIARLNKLI